MVKVRIITWAALVAFALGMVALIDSATGEKIKIRTIVYRVTWEPVAVGDEEGHIIGLFESKGVSTNLQGKKFLDVLLYRELGLVDAKGKTGTSSAQGYGDFTDREVDKIHVIWEGKREPGGSFEGTWAFVGGTGKMKMIQGKGTWFAHSPALGYSCDDWKGEVELSR